MSALSTMLDSSENANNKTPEWGLWYLWWGRWDLNPGSPTPQAGILNQSSHPTPSITTTELKAEAIRRPQRETRYKEQIDKTRPFNLHGRRSRLSQSKVKEYIISSLPGLGQGAARNLLKHFGSVENVMTAPVEELMKVDHVGQKTAKRIRELAGELYES